MTIITFLRKVSPILAIFSSTQLVDAQILYAPNGQVGSTDSNNGVGIGTASPNSKLDVNGTVSLAGEAANLDPHYASIDFLQGASKVLIGWNRSGGYGETDFISNRGAGVRGGFSFYDYSNTGLLTSLLNMTGSGAIGIGVDNPGAKLHVATSAVVSSVSGGGFPPFLNGNLPSTLSVVHAGGNWGLSVTRAVDDSGGANIALYKTRNADPAGSKAVQIGDLIGRLSWHAPDSRSSIRQCTEVGSKVTSVDSLSVATTLYFSTTPLGGTLSERLRIDSDGNVGIGTTNPTQKLSVNGTIRAKEVVVETSSWSDYVLAKDYALAPLSEVERHIQREGHLPGIPSAQEVAEKGVGVGEMQAKLLAKIEELTLHVIEQQKRIERLTEQNAVLNKRIEAVEGC